MLPDETEQHGDVASDEQGRSDESEKGKAAPIRASGSTYGDVSTWPGDTFGISTLSANQVVLSWGSGVLVNNQFRSEIFSDVVTFGH